MLTYLVGAHLIGDFILQDDFMQAKSKDSAICSIHVLFYSIPFFILAMFEIIPLWCISLILIQHWLQDRFTLHLKWMKFYLQTPSDKWPTGPLCVDQSMHIGFLWLLAVILFR